MSRSCMAPQNCGIIYPLTKSIYGVRLVKNLGEAYRMNHNLHSRRYMYMYYRRICL